MDHTGVAGERDAALPDEAALLARLRQGDDAAYETLVRTSAPRLLAVARRITGNDGDAHDAVQDAFVSAFRSIDRFEGNAALGTWLHRITINAALMIVRRRRRRREVTLEPLMPQFSPDGHRIDGATAAGDDGAAGSLETQERHQHLAGALAQLPEDARNVIILRDIEGLDTAAAGEALGITPGAVKTRLHRARQALRGLLERPEDGPDAEAGGSEGSN